MSVLPPPAIGLPRRPVFDRLLLRVALAGLVLNGLLAALGLAEALQVLTYAALGAGVVLLAGSRIKRIQVNLWLDGAIGVFAIAALGSALLPAAAVLDAAWLAGALLVAHAARQPVERVTAKPAGLRMHAMPVTFSILAVVLQICGELGLLNRTAQVLASASLAAVILRMAATFRDNLRLLEASRTEALTDSLTELGNRRCLMSDLSETLAGRSPHVLVLFDLDGFKAYNDSFGHPAGDILLARLGHNLAAAVAPSGRAYRLDGDEFCVLAPAGTRDAEPAIAAGSAALSEEGEGFAITSSWGSVLVPEEAGAAPEALRLADRRMYAQKRWRPRSVERQTRNILLRVLREREPRLDEHLRGVARVAVALAQSVGLDGEELDELARAAELHDIGKIGIPDAILHKSAPLNSAEWSLMRQHPLIGERILASATAMAPVAKIVRSTHERWDGYGYPDGLAGERIPLGARIIAVCDAFQAMTEERPWRGTLTGEEATAELRRTAGTQFDPGLVEAFCTRVFPHLDATMAAVATRRTGAQTA